MQALQCVCKVFIGFCVLILSLLGVHGVQIVSFAGCWQGFSSLLIVGLGASSTLRLASEI